LPNKYASGRETEYKIRRFLDDLGYDTVRSAGSKGAFDIIAWNDLVTRRIQAKREKSKSSYSKDLEKMGKSKSPPNSTKELWIWRTGTGWIKIDIIENTCDYKVEIPETKSFYEANKG